MDQIAGLKPLQSIVKAVKDGAATTFGIGTTTDADQIQKYLKKKKAVEKNTEVYRRQAMTNVAFLYGKHHFNLEKKPMSGGVEERVLWEIKNIDRKKKTLRTSNYILPLYRSILSRMLLMKSRVSVSPDTQDERDISSARVCQELLEDFWANANKSNPVLSQQYAGMSQVLARLFGYTLGVGQGHLKPYFNPDALGKARANGEIIESAIGQVEVEVLHNFELIKDPMHQWACQQKIKSCESIENEFGIEVEPEELSISDFERQLQSLLENSGEDATTDGAQLFMHYELPSKKNKDGVYCVFTEKKMIIQPTGLDPELRGRLPFYTFNGIEIPLVHQPQGMVEQLIPLQEDYNYTLKRIADYKKWMTGKILLPDGAKMSSKWDDEVGQLVKFSGTTGKPEYLAAPAIPQQLFEELNRIRRDMEDIAAAHDISMSRLPQGIKSGVAIQNLSELDNSQLGPALQSIETKLGFFSEGVLQIMQERYTEERLLSITGKTLTADVRTFSGNDAKGNRRIEISLGSGMPTSKPERQQFIMGLVKEGYITREKGLELLEFGDVDGVYSNIDKTAEKSEIQEMLRGAQIEPMPYENHAIRAKILADFMMSDDFKKLAQIQEASQEMGGFTGPEIQQNIYQHYLMTQDFILQEQQAMTQGEPQPAAPGGKKPGKEAAPGQQ